MSVCVRTEISINEFLDNCDKSDMDHLISELINLEKISSDKIYTNSIMDFEFSKKLNTILNNRILLFNEDEELIENIYKKFK